MSERDDDVADAPDVRSAVADTALVEAVADAFERAGRLDLLDEMLVDAVAANPGDLWLAVRYARVAIAQETPAALDRCDLLIVRFPNEGIGYVLRGEVFASLGAIDDAEASFRAAVMVQPDFPWSHIRYAEVAAERGDHIARMHRLKSAILVLPDDKLIAWELAEALIDAECWDEARDILLDGLRANPGDPTLLETLDKVPRIEPVIARVEATREDADIVGVLISRDPVIIHTATGRLDSVIAPVMSIYQRFDIPIYFLVGSVRSIGADGAHRAALSRELREIAVRFPTARICLLANDAQELAAARAAGFESQVVSNNAFVDEKIYRILADTEKKFDAVYNARFMPYKRHELAVETDKLLLLMAEPTEQQVRDAIALLPKAMRNTRHLVPHDVAQALNMARCGLCLSATEGAMYASIEYLLCGLPVVTTRSSGGRDWFFADDYVLYCDPDAAAVREAVAAMTRREVSSELVRAATVIRIQRERLAFFEIVDRIFAENSQPGRRAAAEFRSYFADKANCTARAFAHFIALPSH